MCYRIAGIDVHKKMLAVVVADVEVEGEYEFERRKFGSNPEHLRLLAEWLLEREVEEAVMESTAQYWQPVLGSAGTLLEAELPEARRGGADVGKVASGTGAFQSRTTGAKERFSRPKGMEPSAGLMKRAEA
jgi:hypothetical protein